MPYRSNRLKEPRAPRKLVRGGHVLLALVGVICAICLGTGYFVRG